MAAFLEEGDCEIPSRGDIREVLSSVMDTHPEIAGLIVVKAVMGEFDDRVRGAINVDRDWVEFIQTRKSESVYEIAGPESGQVVLKASGIVKLKPWTVSFPKGSSGLPDIFESRGESVMGGYADA